MHFDLLLTDAVLSAMDDAATGAEGRPDALGVEDGRISWIGRAEDLPSDVPTSERRSLAGRWVTPSLIDCHTHLVFAGDRADEWAMRLAGASYAEIAESGGGIRTTVESTRAASVAQLVDGAASRLRTLAAEGVGTVEVKSGYGLTIEDELRMLRAARTAGEAANVRVVTTLLAAHAVPPEYDGRADAYIDEVCIPAITAGHEEGLLDAVDGFLESIAFDRTQLRRVFEAADRVGLPVRLHADQLSDGGGAAFAAEHGAISADHLEYASDAGIRRLAESGTVAVLLPGAFYGIRETTVPPVQAFRAHGVPMAVATDANPGSSPTLSLLTAANMACTLFGLTVEEAFAGLTVNAARALGRSDVSGVLRVGAPADIAIWDVPGPAHLLQWIGHRPLHGRILEGVWA
jgi:imidazolonepropionase